MPRGKAKERKLVITLGNMHEYMHLSITNFAAYALLLTLGLNAPFEGEPLDVNTIRGRLGIINSEIMTRVERSKKGKIGGSLSKCAQRVIKEPGDYLIREEDFGVVVKLSTNCLMSFEVREFTRVFGGVDEEWINYGGVELPLVKLALLGSDMTYVGKVFGDKQDLGYYLFLDVGLSLDIDPESRANIYRRVHGFLANLGSSDSEGGSNNGKRRKKKKVSTDDVSQVAKIVVPAALVLTGLGDRDIVEDVLDSGIVMHLVHDKGDTVFDLTRIANTIWRAGLAGHITFLAGVIWSGDKVLLDLLNDVSQAVFEAASTGDLLPVYRYVRNVTSLVGSGMASGDLGVKLISTLAPVGGLRWS